MPHRGGCGATALLGGLFGSLVLSACQGASVSDDGLPGSVGGGASAGGSRGVPGVVAQASSTVTLAFAGDVHFEVGLRGLLDRPGSTLGPMSKVLRRADLAMVNLESALAGGGEPARKELEDPARRYWFRSPPSALDLLYRSGVDVVSMANNHGADYGPRGLQDSLRVAKDHPIAVVGVGRNPEQAYRPHRVDIDGTTVAVLAADTSPRESVDPTWAVEAGRGPGIAATRTAAAPRLLAAVREAARAGDVVVVYLHWGEENEVRPTRLQRNLAASLAHAGADVVVGSHAHRLQGAGLVGGGTYVSYGLGNFLWYHGRQRATGVVEVTLTDGQVSDARLHPGRIPLDGGQAQPVRGAARERAVVAWSGLGVAAGLDAAPGTSRSPAVDPPPAGSAGGDSTRADEPKPSALSPYKAQVRRIRSDVRQRMLGNSHRPGCPVPLRDLRHLRLTYIDFNDEVHRGSMVVHEAVADDVVDVFRSLYRARFPVQRMRLVDTYGGDDDRSMAANNTSGYNCRRVAGSADLSDHAYGRAIDINPVQNPYVTSDDVRPPAGRRFVSVGRDPVLPRYRVSSAATTRSPARSTASAGHGVAFGVTRTSSTSALHKSLERLGPPGVRISWSKASRLRFLLGVVARAVACLAALVPLMFDSYGEELANGPEPLNPEILGWA